MSPRTRVLLVEDNPDDILLSRLALAASGLPWELAITESGAGALEHLATHPVDLVLLDLSLPDHSGLAVLAQLRASAFGQTVPVVVVTSSGTPRDSEASYRAGANLFLQKPLSLRAFTNTLRDQGPTWLDLSAPPRS
jgi:CheY-like chemotaxis protein